MSKRRTATIGDVAEIPTRHGLAYAQVSHDLPSYGPLLRVLPGFFERRPADLQALADQRASFVAFFPLKHAVRKGRFEIVARCRVPEFAQSFPLFRSGFIDPKTGKVKTWWLWDGEKEWPVGSLTKEQHELPIRAVWNDTLLLERIEQGWTPEKSDW